MIIEIALTWKLIKWLGAIIVLVSAILSENRIPAAGKAFQRWFFFPASLIWIITIFIRGLWL